MSPAKTADMLKTIDAYLPHVDRHAAGLLRFSSDLLNALDDQGLTVNLFVAHSRSSPEWITKFRTRVLFQSTQLRGTVAQHLIRVLRLCWLQFVYPFSRWLRRQQAPLLVLAHESAPVPLWPQICVVHDLTALKSFSGDLRTLRRFQHWCWILALRRSRWIVCISNRTRDDLLSYYPELAPRVVTIHEGVDRRVFNEDDRGDATVTPQYALTKRYLLYAGTLAPHKNVDFLIPVLADLRRRFTDLELIVVGKHENSARSRLIDIALERGVADSIFLPGYVSDDRLAVLMRHSAAFVFPSLNEGFGLAPVEAMSCGAPVVASSAGSLPEVLSDGALLVEPSARDKWAAALTIVLDNSTIREQLRARGLARAAKLTWTSTASRYLELLDSAATPAQPGEIRTRFSFRRRRMA